jgi:hypothetical protein
MKTVFTFFASLMMSAAVFAAARPTSVLSVKSADNSDIRVVLDGKRFQPNDNSIYFDDLESGRHDIKIYRERKSRWFSLSGHDYELVFNTAIDLKRRTHLFITIEKNGHISMMENKIRREYDRRNDDRDYGNGGQWGGYDQHDGYTGAMSDREFKGVLRSISDEWLESNKLKSATQVVINNRFTTAQVEQLVLLFSFENNKLDLAKQAYRNTVDKENYRNLFDVFSFNSSKRELAQYMESCR